MENFAAKYRHLDQLETSYYFDLSEFTLGDVFIDVVSVLGMKKRLCEHLGQSCRRNVKGKIHKTAIIDGQVTVEPGAVIGAGAVIEGPAIICSGAIVRNGALIRDNVIVGGGSVIGHGTEVTRSIVMNNSRATHFSFIGDSVIGNSVNIGSSTVLSNLRADTPVTDPATEEIFIRLGGLKIGSGYTKFGSIIGDGSQTGALISLAPGTLIGPRSQVFPQNQCSGAFVPYSRVRA